MRKSREWGSDLRWEAYPEAKEKAGGCPFASHPVCATKAGGYIAVPCAASEHAYIALQGASRVLWRAFPVMSWNFSESILAHSELFESSVDILVRHTLFIPRKPRGCNPSFNPVFHYSNSERSELSSVHTA